MRVRRVARWLAGLVAVTAFGVASVLGINAASADETTDPPASNGVGVESDHWD